MITNNGFTLSKVSKSYGGHGDSVAIFDGLDLHIGAGEFVVLMGPSGSGKTTLLNLLAGIDTPDSGEIWCNGARMDNLSQAGLGNWRSRNIGFVFQSYNLLPMLSAADNVSLPLALTGLPSAERRRRVAAALELAAIGECAGRRPSQLSGGQQQRVAIARAIVADAPALLCDEPTGNLDRATSVEVFELLQLLHLRMGKTIVMVTHDQQAAGYASRVLQLDKGRFVDA